MQIGMHQFFCSSHWAQCRLAPVYHDGHNLSAPHRFMSALLGVRKALLDVLIVL